VNYTQLVNAINDYAENNFPVDVVNRFIEQAEQKIYNSVQLPSLRKNVTGATSPANKYLSAPDDYLASFSLAVILNYGTANEEYRYLLNKDVNFIRQAYPSPNDTGVPQYYALFGPRVDNFVISNELSFILGPTPDLVYRMELHYFYYPESIVTAQETWLGDNFDTALLNACLMEAITYMKGEPDMVALYKSRYDEAMALLKQLGDAKEKGDAYRNGLPRYPVT
jgi:hypothetical protein